jgi:probable DNA metabolism protein
MHSFTTNTFDEWRTIARTALAHHLYPSDANFHSAGNAQHDLFNDAPTALTPAPDTPRSVPPEFLKHARRVACHRDPQRWNLLYRLLWRLTHGERHLLEVATDDDIILFTRMSKAVARDAHKAQAFVRFRRVEDESGEHFIAWHRPDHRILRLVAPFFSRRFPTMHWSILTPDESVAWDGSELAYGPGAPASAAPTRDALDEMWRTYYRSTFNPARIKLGAMRREMPVRYWPALPETQILPDMLAEAPSRVANMLAQAPQIASMSAAGFLPASRDLASLAAAACACQGCQLHARATQTVFGRGPAGASIMLVGEQPGDQEDLHGEPFVGPAGQVLNEALAAIGLGRDAVYITNAVKHFHWEPRGKRRLHKKPPSRAVDACLPWLRAEVEAVQPQALVCLGVTAAQALLGRDSRLLQRRGELMPSEWSANTIITWHPAAILRARSPEQREQQYSELVRDLQLANTVAARTARHSLP